ncbi:MAG: phage terminase small subunit [Clostridium sp.]
MESREEAFILFKESNGRLSSQKIADKLNVKVSKVKYWRSKDKWKDNLNRSRGAPKGNKSALGNKGGAPKGNLNSLKHGKYIDERKHLSKKFLAKYIPKATEKIIEDIVENSLTSIDILWSNILLKFAAIIRSQKIMNVKNQKDLTKELKKKEVYEGEEVGSEKIEYEIQFAWDKQATFLNAQAKAMKELTNMLMQYEKLVNTNYELVDEEHRLRVELLKSKIPNENESKEDKIDRYFVALEGVINAR